MERTRENIERLITMKHKEERAYRTLLKEAGEQMQYYGELVRRYDGEVNIVEQRLDELYMELERMEAKES